MGSSKQSFSACKDNLAAVKDAAAHGKDIKDMPLHTCECPPCFMQKGKGCEPRCDLAQCDMKAGVCAGGTATSALRALSPELETLSHHCAPSPRPRYEALRRMTAPEAAPGSGKALAPRRHPGGGVRQPPSKLGTIVPKAKRG